MEWLKNKDQLAQNFKKYRYAMLALLIGTAMMLIPEKASVPEPAVQELLPAVSQLQQDLERILSLVKGAGKVAVLLTQKTGEETFYQTDEDLSSSEHSDTAQSKTVMATTVDRAQTGLIRQVNPPQLRGAVIVCQGGDDPQVKLAIVEAVMRATGLPSSSISVLKMK